MDRRQFLSALGVGMAALTARKVLAEPEPVRRYWQVPGNAPVGSIARENRLFCAVENGVQPLSVSAETFAGGSWECRSYGDTDFVWNRATLTSGSVAGSALPSRREREA